MQLVGGSAHRRPVGGNALLPLGGGNEHRHPVGGNVLLPLLGGNARGCFVDEARFDGRQCRGSAPRGRRSRRRFSPFRCVSTTHHTCTVNVHVHVSKCHYFVERRKTILKILMKLILRIQHALTIPTNTNLSITKPYPHLPLTPLCSSRGKEYKHHRDIKFEKNVSTLPGEVKSKIHSLKVLSKTSLSIAKQ